MHQHPLTNFQLSTVYKKKYDLDEEEEEKLNACLQYYTQEHTSGMQRKRGSEIEQQPTRARASACLSTSSASSL